MELRVWWIRNPPGHPESYPVSSVEQAKAKLKELTQRDLREPSVAVNVGGLEEKVEGEWVTYYDDEGRDIDALMEEEGE